MSSNNNTERNESRQVVENMGECRKRKKKVGRKKRKKKEDKEKERKKIIQ